MTDELVLDYTLAELPSSQHRAGLAGLVLMHHWLGRQPGSHGLCELSRPDSRSVRLRLDRDGLAALFDQVYGAALGEVESKTLYKRKGEVKEPRRTEERTQTSKTGKVTTRTVYIYDTVVPEGAFVADWDPGRDRGAAVWTKLWRDMVWSIMRGVPATRAPFEARARKAGAGAGEGETDKLVPDTWRDLARPDAVVALPSTYYLGAQTTTAENVSFRDRARWQFLLHFWPFVAAIHVPAEIDNDGKRRFRGYALAIPDVADLDEFCDNLEEACRVRSTDVAGYVPAQAVIDVAAESGLEFLGRLTRRVGQASEDHADMVHGVDVFHVEKQGNNVRTLGIARVDPDEDLGEYRRLRDAYRSALFRQQRVRNFFAGAPRWYAGFDRLLCLRPIAQTIEDSWFRRDVRNAFTTTESHPSHPSHPIHEPTPGPSSHREPMTTDDTTQTQDPNTEPSSAGPDDSPMSLEALIYRIVGRYIAGKLESKYQLKWEKVKERPKEHDDRESYDKNRLKIAKDAFFAVRSRTGAEFVDYFTGTLCSVPQRMSQERYAVVARALLDDTEKERDRVRTLTLLALSAQA